MPFGSPGSKTFTRGFLIVAPGLTIKDRLRCAAAERSRQLLREPRAGADRHGWPISSKAKIVITNYHAFKLRERMELSRRGRARCCRAAASRSRHARDRRSDDPARHARADGPEEIMVINDEAHHCYRHKPGRQRGRRS